MYFCFSEKDNMYCGSILNNTIKEALPCTDYSTKYVEELLVLECTEVNQSGKSISFYPENNLLSQAEMIKAQSVWFRILMDKMANPEKRVILKEGITSLDQLRSSGMELTTTFDSGPLKCKNSLNLFLFPENSILEHLHVSYPGK